MQPYCPVPRCRNLVVLKVQELVGWHVVGHDILAVSLHHHREDDAVEHDVVLADEVYQPRVLVLPPLFPVTPLLRLLGTQLHSVRHIADGGIKPHIEHLSLGALYGHGDAPVQVASHGAGLQVHVEPRLALSVHVRAPLLVLLQYPLLQPLLILVQRQVPVLGLLQHGCRTTDGRLRVNQLRGAQVTSALLALVAVGSLVVAVGALARHIAVGQKLLGLLVIQLCRRLFHQFALVVELAEPLGGKLMMRLRSGAAVDVERDAELLERVLNHFMIAVHHVLRRDALLAGTHGDGHAVLVRATNKQHLALLQPQIAHINVGRHVDASQVTDVYAAVSVWQGRRHRYTFILLLFHKYE